MDLKGYNETVVKRVDAALAQMLDVGEQDTLRKAMMHLPLSGGKRLRPSLAMLVADCVAGEGGRALPFGLALEIIHNFTLVHDDIMDRDDYRRGVKTVHKKWDEPTAINAGDALFARAFEILTTVEVTPEVFRELVYDVANMVRRIGEGQQWDMEFERRKDVTEKEYIQMIERKTALMFMTGAKGGALIAGGTRRQVDAMWDYGQHLGIGFQIHDDWLNLAGDPKKFKKPIGGDLVTGKKTIIVLHAFENAGKKELAPVMKVFGKNKGTKAQLSQAIEALRAAGALDYAQDQAKAHADRALEQLKTLPDNEHREILRQLVKYMVERDH